MVPDGIGWIWMDSDRLSVFRQPLRANQNRMQSQFSNHKKEETFIYL